ncbi:phosphoglycolate phosphatase [Pararhodobacter zhoushanensis]|uniref:phosphoglycolate phosphatase n=1 Tax=Pararhodobacter zhoushanensis TaxID=2479545 RepID=A0ABT3GUR5_9RHOB|nr:phosphoglycolate phosphatase [Pararhodobacter zhoushanensis]MCW1931274.1 phosphoglycolate phosphatase [Pararhodobacter zhoushanensis]
MRAIFDLDGTLVDSALDIHAAGNRTLAAEGLPLVTPDQARSFVGRGAKVFVDRLERAASGTNDPARTERMRARFAAEYEIAHDFSTVYPGVETALATLKAQGWQLGLCTNKPLRPALAVLAHFGWSEMFEVVIAGDSLPVTKPDPAPLLAAMQALDDSPLVYVGDSEVDARTAQAARVPFALYTLGYRKSPIDQIPHAEAFDDWSTLPAIAHRLAR